LSAYVIVNVREFDQSAEMTEYSARLTETLAAHHGVIVVRGGGIDVREGTWPARWLVIVEFPSADAARGWYESPEYQEILPMRKAHADLDLLIVEGV
jgi:uncharacterized protein (DUF1330 family)